MEKSEIGQGPALWIKPEAIMSAFCYAFTFSLLQKLKKLKEKNLIFEDGSYSNFTPLVEAIITQLQSQTHLNLCECRHHLCAKGSSRETEGNALNKIIELVEEFLGIFQVEALKKN